MPKKAASLFSVDVINSEWTDQPVHMRIAERIRAAIQSGALQANARLPSGRTLARDFKVARNTVDEALSQLVSEGLVKRQRGAGSFVVPSRAVPGEQSPNGLAKRPAKLSHRAVALQAYPGRTGVNRAAPFAPSLPPPEFFPRKAWRRLLAREIARPGNQCWESGPSNGLLELREAIAAHSAALRCTRAAPDQIIVTTSTQQAVELAAKVLADPDDCAWVETPGYQPAAFIIRSTGVETVPVPVDAEGLEVDAGMRLSPHARFAYVTPAHQYPTGVEMSLARRKALLAWATAEDSFVIEDDYDGEFRYEGNPITSLQDLDHNRVIYVGSFNKLLFSGLRLAYAIVPRGLVGAFIDAKHAADDHTAMLSQTVLAAFIKEGHLAEHLRKTRAVYDERRREFLKQASALNELVEFGPALAGLHVTATFRDQRVIDRRVVELSAERGVLLQPLSRHGTARQGLVFGFTTATPESCARALEVVVASIRSVLP